MFKTERIQLIVTLKDRRAWARAAVRAGLSLNEFLRRQVNASLLPTPASSARAVRMALLAVRRELESAEQLLLQSRTKRKPRSRVKRRNKSQRA